MKNRATLTARFIGGHHNIPSVAAALDINKTHVTHFQVVALSFSQLPSTDKERVILPTVLSRFESNLD